MPIDQYLEKLEGIRTDNKLIKPALNILNPEDYIILEGKVRDSYSYPDLLVSMKRCNYQENWLNTHRELHKEDSFMLNLRQFADFINLLKAEKVYNGIGERLTADTRIALLDSIYHGGLMPQGEYLDAFFKVNSLNKSLIFCYEHRLEKGFLQASKFEVVESQLGDNQIMGINIDEWINLSGAVRVRSNIFFGDIKYIPPVGVNDSVVGFTGDPDGASLDCNYDPRGHYIAFGVRKVKIKE